MAELRSCPVCPWTWAAGDWDGLAGHLVETAAASDPRHVMWLNRRVTKYRTDAATLARLLPGAVDGAAPADGAVADRVRR